MTRDGESRIEWGPRKPAPWALLSGAGLVVALSVTSKAPDWLFWGAVGLSCLGAAMATLLARKG